MLRPCLLPNIFRQKHSLPFNLCWFKEKLMSVIQGVAASRDVATTGRGRMRECCIHRLIILNLTLKWCFFAILQHLGWIFTLNLKKISQVSNIAIFLYKLVATCDHIYSFIRIFMWTSRMLLADVAFVLVDIKVQILIAQLLNPLLNSNVRLVGIKMRLNDFNFYVLKILFAS